QRAVTFVIPSGRKSPSLLAAALAQLLHGRRHTMASRLRVIVATPHEPEREVLADWLSSDGLDPVRFSTSADAADDMRAHDFDLLITDFAFGFRDGLDVIG